MGKSTSDRQAEEHNNDNYYIEEKLYVTDDVVVQAVTIIDSNYSQQLAYTHPFPQDHGCNAAGILVSTTQGTWFNMLSKLCLFVVSLGTEY